MANDVGFSLESSPSNLVTLPGFPDGPSQIQPASSATQITLNWTVGANNGLPITGFAIKAIADPAGTDPSFTVNAGAVGSALDPTPGAHDSAVIPDTAPGTQYYQFAIASLSNGTTSGYVYDYDNIAELLAPSLQPVDGTSLHFDSTLVGDVSDDLSFGGRNIGAGAGQVKGYVLSGADPDDFFLDSSNCQNLAAYGATCSLNVAFLPGAVGLRTATLTLQDGSSNLLSIPLSGDGFEGYYEATSTGAIFGSGEAPYYGVATSPDLAKPIVAIQSTGDDGGYWMAASDGGNFQFW